MATADAKVLALRSALIVLSLLCVSPTAALAQPTQPLALDLGTLGGSNSTASGVSEMGQVVGYSDVLDDIGQHAFSWTRESGMVDLGTLGGTNSVANAVNDAGQVVGYSDVDDDVAQHAFVWTRAGGMVDLGTLGGSNSIANAVNNRGQVVGSALTADGLQHAFSWTASAGMIDLGTLGGAASIARDVNDRGQVVGFASRTGTEIANSFSWTPGGGIVDLGTLGGSNAFVFEVNAAGQAIGWSYTAGNARFHAFLWSQHAGMVSLGTLGGDNSEAYAINATGQIVGTSTTRTGYRAFLWTPATGMMSLGTLGPDSFARDVNENGHVVGDSPTGYPQQRAFWWSEAEGIVDLGTLGGGFATVSSRRAINNSGDVVGTSTLENEAASHAVLWRVGADANGQVLPPPWAATDIGVVGMGGDSSGLNDAFVVSGTGADIWGTADAFRFVYRPLIANGSVTARLVNSVSLGASPFAKAGIMLRDSLDPSSASVILDVKPDGGVEFMARYGAAQATIYLAGDSTDGAPSVWLQLARDASNKVTASLSSDGMRWRIIGSAVVPFASADVLAGLAVTSHDPSSPYLAKFDHVSVTTTDAEHRDNLLSDGDFEEYAPPALGSANSGWVSDHLMRQEPAKSEVNQPRSGFTNGACWTPAFLDCGIYQEIIAPATGSYSLRVYASADRPGGLVGANVNGYVATSADVAVRPFGDYALYSATFDATIGDVIRVWMYSPASPGYVVIDDVSLTRTP